MVCSSPIVVKNPKIAFHKGVDKPYLSLPCGHCNSCRFAIQEEWCIRAYYHWLKYNFHHGKTIFVTLTYNDEHLPRVKEDGFDFCCFSKKDIDRFLNSFRQHFKTKFHIGENGSLGIDYLVCCEYGSKNTYRSHMHVLLFIPDCDNISVRYIKERIIFYWEKQRNLGFVRFSKEEKGGALVRSYKCIQYVSKYMTKDLDFYNKEDIVEFLKISGNKEKIRDKLPRHYQSKGFGESMLDFLNSLPNGKLYDIIQNGISLPFDQYRYKLPRYIKNKLFFDYAKTSIITGLSKKSKRPIYRSVRLLSNFGLEYQSNTFFEYLRKKVDSLSLDISAIGLQKFFTDELDLNIFMQECYTNECFDYDYIKLQGYLESFLEGHSIYDLAAYALVYRDYEPSVYYKFDSYDIDYLTYVAADVFNHRLKYVFYDTSYRDLESQSRFVGTWQSFRDLVPDYIKFEFVLTFLEKARSRISGRKADAKVEKIKSNKYLQGKILGY